MYLFQDKYSVLTLCDLSLSIVKLNTLVVIIAALNESSMYMKIILYLKML